MAKGRLCTAAAGGLAAACYVVPTRKQTADWNRTGTKPQGTPLGPSVLEVPQPPQAGPQAEDQVFKHMSLRETLQLSPLCSLSIVFLLVIILFSCI